MYQRLTIKIFICNNSKRFERLAWFFNSLKLKALQNVLKNLYYTISIEISIKVIKKGIDRPYRVLRLNGNNIPHKNP
jgi:hypothetical protein